MSDAKPGAAPAADRGAWLRDRRRVNEQQEDALAGGYDAQWGEIEDTHQGFVERFLSELPPAGRVLDAACGTGKYFPLVLASGRSLLGVDNAAASLAIAAAKFPQIPTERHDLQELPYRGEFDGKSLNTVYRGRRSPHFRESYVHIPIPRFDSYTG